MLLNNVAPDCWLIVGPVVQPLPAGKGKCLLRGAGHTAMERCWNLCSPLLLLFSAGPCCHLLPLLPHHPPSSTHMTEEPPEQLGLAILVSRAIVCPPSLSPVCPTVNWQPASADYRRCGSKRNPLWQWQAYDLQDMLVLSNNTSSRGSGCITPALRTHHWADSLTH